MDKRTFLKTGFMFGAGSLVLPVLGEKNPSWFLPESGSTDEFQQLPLKYAFNALEPYIDAQTMELHYTKHHAGYTSRLNSSVKQENLSGKTLQEILAGASKYSESIRNNGGGHYNHNFFWQCLSPGTKAQPKSEILNALSKHFGSFDNFKKEFTQKAISVFGSGWAWLINQQDKLKIISTPNQDNPLMDLSPEKGIPILALDVWEHAYYLRYQNRRAEYIESFWNIVNWDFVSSNLGTKR
jgi:Fe-Mn family superoxide dismutase